MFADVTLPGEDAQEGRRSAIEMACDVLKVISDEGQTKPTHILQKANMNWSTLCSNLDYLCVRGLVERVSRHGKRIEYRLTLKGKSILELYEGLKFSLRGLDGDQTRHGHRPHPKSSNGLDWSIRRTWTVSAALT
jgi:predicted transcriptional regulator